jgi:hypothetical protein
MKTSCAIDSLGHTIVGRPGTGVKGFWSLVIPTGIELEAPLADKPGKASARQILVLGEGPGYGIRRDRIRKTHIANLTRKAKEPFLVHILFILFNV